MKEIIKCPDCGSTEISKPVLTPRAFAISLLLLGFPLPFIGKKCHCFDCQHDFKMKDAIIIHKRSSKN